jgi:hypothetical protein
MIQDTPLLVHNVIPVRQRSDAFQAFKNHAASQASKASLAQQIEELRTQRETSIVRTRKKEKQRTYDMAVKLLENIFNTFAKLLQEEKTQFALSAINLPSFSLKQNLHLSEVDPPLPKI